MHANEEPQNRWSYILPLQLTNLQVQLDRSSLLNYIMEDYELVKNVFLTALGDTPEQPVVDSGKGSP